MVNRPSLRVNEVIGAFANAQEPIDVTLPGITSVVSPRKLLKALAPIKVTAVPIVREEAFRLS